MQRDLDRYQPDRGRLRLPTAGVAREPWMRPAADLQPDPVPGQEDMGGRTHRHGHVPRPLRAGRQPEQPITEVERLPVRVYVAEPREDVCPAVAVATGTDP